MPRPFLRWAGGKSWLAHRLNALFQLPEFNNYHEPFFGGGSVYLAINPQHEVYLSDLNQELIDTYIAIRDFPIEVIAMLRKYENTEQFYYDLRANVPIELTAQAARFIYLNQTSFNGIYRVNNNGQYNVPYGYRQKNFLEEDKLLEISLYLQGAHIFQGDFDIIRKNLNANDLVFLDPPYTISHIGNKNGFIKYNQRLFSLDDQYRLSELIDFIKEIGAYYILTNAFHTIIQEIFFREGDYLFEVNRASLIGGENARRGQVSEYIFTNIREGN